MRVVVRSPQRAQGRYWRMNGTDFVVYASCPEAHWASMGPVLRAVAESAQPK